MKTIQVTKLNMYLAVRNFILRNETIAKLIPFFAVMYAVFENLIREIQAISEMQKDVITGVTKEKKKLKATVIRITTEYSRILAAVAKFAKDDNLMDKVRLRAYELRRMTEVALKDYAEIIYKKVEENLDKLAAYELTPETQKSFRNIIDSYNTALSTPRTGIAMKSQVTRRLSELFDAADAALSELDFAIEAGEAKQPEFYKGYKAVRRIVDTGSGRLALKATASDISSGQPIKGVLFIFKPDGVRISQNGGNGEIVKRTADKGKFHIKNMQAGTYKVLAVKPGYKEKETTVTILEGESINLKVELEKA